MNTYSGPTKLARALKAIQAIMLTLTLVTMSFPVSAFAKKDNEENGHTPVTVCHNGSALTVDDDAVSGHEGHGDTVLHPGEKQDGDDALCSEDDEDEGDDEDNDEDEDTEDEDEGGDEDNDDEEDNEDEGDDEDNDEDTVSCTLSAVPSSITVGGNSTLTLSIEGEDADELSAEVDNEVGELSDSDTAVVTPVETTTYTATIHGEHEDDDKKKHDDEDEDEDTDEDEDWTATCSVTVTVTPADDDEEDTDDGAQCVIVSDTVTMQGEMPVALVTFIHGAWNTVTAALNPAKWIWGEDPVSPANTAKTETFTRTFSLVTAPSDATLEMSADNGYIVTVNGEEVDDKSGVETNYSSVHSYEIGDLLVEGENTLEFTVTNFAQSGGTPTSNPAGLIYKLSVADANCGDPEVDHITVIASKVVCTDEKDLPNWGTGSSEDEDYVSPITATTAEDWVENHESCSLVEDWQFEWGNQSAPDMGNDFIGESENENYNLFSAGDEVSIPLSALGEGSSFHLREVLKEGYIPFTYNNDSEDKNGDDVSAEFYCADDVLNYDNWDYINNPEEGETYYCVGFNAPKEKEAACNPEINLLANGSFEAPDVTNGAGWDAFSTGTLGLEWLADFLGVAPGGKVEIHGGVNGWLASEGAQYTELDSDINGPSSPGGLSAVEIAQNISTVAGQKYHVSFDFSARPGTAATENSVGVYADGNPVGIVSAVVPTVGNQTEWDSYGFDFTAGDTNTLFALRDLGTPNNSVGTFVDNVKVTCVPEEDETTITVTKLVAGNSNYGPGDFPLFVGEEGVVSGVATEFEPGTYTVYESSNADFTPSFSGDCVADEGNESRLNLVSDLQAKKDALQAAIDASEGDTDEDAVMEAAIFDITEKITALQNSLSATITVEEGEDAQCTITNTYNPKSDEEGTLVIEKYTEGGDGEFEFIVHPVTEMLLKTLNSTVTIETEEGEGESSIELSEGNYNVTENVPEGWSLDDWSCEYDGESEGNVIENGENIYIEAGETVTCTFYNTKDSDGGEPTNTFDYVTIYLADLESNVLSALSNAKWFEYNDSTDVIDNTLGAFVTGPAVAPAGTGSIQFSLAPNPNDRKDIATFAYQGTLLADIASLSFSAFSASGVAGPTESPYLVMNTSFTGADVWQKRLVYVPANNGAVPQDTWNTFDTINGGNGVWVYSGATWPAGVGEPGTTLGTTGKTWAQILTTYPSAKILPTGGLLGVRVGEPGPDGYVGSVDRIIVGVTTGSNTDTVTYDFEPGTREENPSDVCNNIEDIQSELPAGMQFNGDGGCETIPSSRGSHRHGGGGGEVLGASTCGPLLTSYLKLGWANDADQVSKLQDFLNTNMGAMLPVSGFFGLATHEAVKAFQKAHWEDVLKPWVGVPGSGIDGENTPTGFVYQTTRWQINNIFCPGSEAFPAKLD